MKKLVTLIAVMLVCANAASVTIQYSSAGSGAKDSSLTALAGGDVIDIYKVVGTQDAYWPLGDDLYLGSGQVDGIGVPFFLAGQGLFEGAINTAAAASGDSVYVRAWNTGMTETAVSQSALIDLTGNVTISAPGLVAQIIPEPSLMLSGLALLLLRKRS